MKRTEQLPMMSATPPELATITPGDIRRLLAETAVAVANGEITVAEAERTIRDCRRITRELNQRATAALKVGRLVRGPKPK